MVVIFVPLMKIFLSHTENDHSAVLAIGKFLTDNGFDVWIDECMLRPGDFLIPKIRDSIESSDRMIVCLSPDAVNSRNKEKYRNPR